MLGTRDWRTLRSAWDLVEQMRQNIYPEDLTMLDMTKLTLSESGHPR
jgi:hypothetical protein